MKVTIHQPDFMPWLGFFSKINKADKWVILNHTENNPRDAAFWGRRVKILVNETPTWLSLPLEKPSVPGLIGLPINKMKFSYSNPDVYKKSLTQLEMSYKKAPFFNEIFPVVETFFNSNEQLMEKRNLKFIFQVMEKLRIETETIYSDQLRCIKGSTELLVEIVKKVEGDIYLCGDGASGYQKDELFAENGIALEYNNFISKPYFQFNSKGDFKAGLSIVDALMNIGYEGVREIL